MKRATFVCLVVATVLSSLLSSCNTFVGMSRDIQRFGQGVENSANGRQF